MGFKMRAGRNGTSTTQRHCGEYLCVVPRQYLQMSISDQCLRFARVTAAVFHRADIGVLSQRQQGVPLNHTARAVRNVVDDQRCPGSIRNGGEPVQQARLGRPDVMGCRHQKTGKRVRRQDLDPSQGLWQVVMGESHHNRQFATRFKHGAQNGQLFSLIEGSCFAGRAADDKTGHTGCSIVANQPGERGVIYRALAKRGDQGEPKPGKVAGGTAIPGIRDVI